MRRREDARGRSRLRYSFHSVDHPWSDHGAVGAREALKFVVETDNLVGEDRLEIVEGFGVVDVEGGTVAQEPTNLGCGVLLLSLIPADNSFEQAHVYAVTIADGDNGLGVLGEQLPPYPGPGWRNLGLIRPSMPMVFATA